MKMNKCGAAFLSLALVLSLVACGGGRGGSGAANDPYKDPYANPYANPNAGGAASTTESAAHEAYMPEPGEGAKYAVTATSDGWLLLENEGGEAIGLSPTSGVHIVEADGYAFRDLNQNGELDPYEDWRLSSEERTSNLVEQMSGAEAAAILSHGGWGDFTTEPLTATDGSYTYITAGGRGGVTRQIARGGGEHAKWANAIQAAAESCWYGIPAMISIDPANISGLVESVSLASTMDPELAAAIGQETAKQYRASGVTALLGPQVDIASPVMKRAGGTYGEDPQLTLDIATAYVNALQSTYDESGEDIGWGAESVYCFTKHYGGAGSTEGGRDDHHYDGRYAVFPGDNLEAHLITYFDGVFNLPGKTGVSGIMTEYAVNVDGDGNPIGGEWAGAYNPYLYGLLDSFGYDSLKITDWGVIGDFGPGAAGVWSTGVWGAENLEETERIALCWERGGNLLGGYGNNATVAAAYEKLVERNGQEKADEIVRHAAYNFILVMMNLNMFDQPYSDSAYADAITYSDSANAYGLETERRSVVMVKNDGTIQEGGVGSEKPTVYIPYVYDNGFGVSWFTGVQEEEVITWAPGMDLDIMGKYFNVVTDTLGSPSGPKDADGNATYTTDDLTRASAEEISGCDFILVGMTGAYTMSYESNYRGVCQETPVEDAERTWYPTSLQYAPYTADTARNPSISGVVDADGNRENRSYKGQTSHIDANYGHLEALEYAASVAGEIPVVVSMCMERGMVWTEVEPLADVILVCYNKQWNEAVAEILLGQTEPTGLLVFQQPASMEAVEAQTDDVPRDMEVYTDAVGNRYDFGFGLNWFGVIQDSRTEKYSAAPLTKISNPAFQSNG